MEIDTGAATGATSEINVAKCQAFSDTGVFPTPATSNFSLVNGIETTDYSATVALLSAEGSFCTGTFVSPTTLITASHCVDPNISGGGLRLATGNSMTDVSAAYAAGVSPIKVFQSGPPSTTDQEPLTGEMDLAVLVFDRPAAPATVSLLDRAIINGEEIVAVGFGALNVEDSTEGETYPVKRYGKNYAIVDESGACAGLFAVGRTAHAYATSVQTDVLSGSGDSGGPVFIDDKLAAIVSTSGIFPQQPDQSSAFYVTLDSDSARLLLKKAITDGADVTLPQVE